MDGEVNHRYYALQKRAENINSLASQFIFRQNQNIHLSELIGSLKQLSGPVYLSGDTESNYNEIIKTAVTFKNIYGPIFVKDGEKYEFNVLTKSPESL